MHYFLKNYIHTSQYYTLPLVIFQGDKLKILHKIIAGYLVVLTEKEEEIWVMGDELWVIS